MNPETEIGAGPSKSQCLKPLDNVALTREPLTITNQGKAVVRLVPTSQTLALFGALTGSVMKAGDIISPLKNEWDSAR